MIGVIDIGVIVEGVHRAWRLGFSLALIPNHAPYNTSMPPLPPSPTPRIVIYYQTQHNPDGSPCSILPIITQPDIAVTHVNVAAIHINDPPGLIHLVRVQMPYKSKADTFAERPCSEPPPLPHPLGRTSNPPSRRN